MQIAALMAMSSLLFFSAGEIGARWWIAAHGNALDITRSILQIDPSVGWRTRANLDTSFLGVSLRTNEWGWRAPSVQTLDSSKNTILVLGPSSTFGWGVSGEYTYASQLEEIIGSTTPVQVLNAGEIGYSSYQGTQILAEQKVAALKPKVVIIAYGVNDLDRNRFYFQSNKTDAQEFAQPKSAAVTAVANIFFRSSLVSLLFKGMSSAVLALRGGVAAALDPQHPIPYVRVPVDNFKSNLLVMVHRARILGAHVILLTTEVNLKEVASTTPSENSDSLYALSAQRRAAGDYSAANYYYEKALAYEPQRISRDVDAYNNALKDIAVQENVMIGDVGNWFAGYKKDSLFVDPIHFSSSGNALIAKGLYDIIQKGDLLIE